MTNTKKAKAALAAAFNDYAAPPCYYDNAPAGAALPYSVIKNVHISPLNAGDLLSFTLEIHADETAQNSAESLETLCDNYRNAADGSLLTDKETFYGHINFDSQEDGSHDAEADLSHRQQLYSLRLFYL